MVTGEVMMMPPSVNNRVLLLGVLVISLSALWVNAETEHFIEGDHGDLIELYGGDGDETCPVRHGFPLRLLQEIRNGDGDRVQVKILSKDPLVVVFEHFLSDAECNILESLAEREGYFASGVGGTTESTIMSKGTRNSEQVWLIRDMEHPALQRIEKRVEQVTSVPSANYEHFQVVRYNGRNKFYREHSDFVPEMIGTWGGVRLATFFMYLSNNFVSFAFCFC